MSSYRFDNFISQVSGGVKKLLNSGYQFPLFGQSKNTILSRQGKKSYCHRLTPHDLDQVSPTRYNEVYRGLVESLNRLSEKHFYKIFVKDGLINLNTSNDDFRFGYYQKELLEKPLELFFDGNRVFSDIFFGSDYMKVNGKYIRIISFNSLGFEKLRLEEFEDFNSYAIIFKKKNPFVLRQSLELRRNIHGHSFAKPKRDINGEKAYNAIEEMMEAIVDGRESIFKVLPLIYIIESDFKSLNSKTDWALEHLTTKGHSPFLESAGLRYFYNQILFGVTPTFNIRGHELKTSDLVKLLPASRDYLCDSGVEFESRSGKKIYYDLEKIGNNSNALFCGPTGRGKSYLALTTLNYYVERGHKAFILEYKDSARKFTMWHQGKSFGKKINLVQFKNTQYLVDCVNCLIGEDEKLGRMEEGRLIEIIEQGINEQLFNTNKEFIDYLESNFKGIKYYFSAVKKFLTDEIVEGNASVVHCDLEQFNERICGVIILYLFQMFKEFNGKKIFFVDEIYKAIKNEKEAVSISEHVRNVRKDGDSFWWSIQNLNDVTRYNFLGAIHEGCEHEFVFEHDQEITIELEPHKRRVIGELRGANVEDGVYTRTNREFSKFVILNSINTKVAHLRRDNLFYEILTTEDEDTALYKDFEQERGRFFKNFRERMTKFAELKYGN